MANVNLPTPVLIAGGVLCLLGGYLIGVVAGPDTPDRTTGTVESYNSGSQLLCLGGDAVSEQDGVNEDGQLCGVWQRSPGSLTPSEGDSFRFVVKRTASDPSGSENADEDQILIYGDVVD